MFTHLFVCLRVYTQTRKPPRWLDGWIGGQPDAQKGRPRDMPRVIQVLAVRLVCLDACHIVVDVLASVDVVVYAYRMTWTLGPIILV